MFITINGKNVNKISGPVSMYVLYPKIDYLKEHRYAPIFILFGDSHHSNKGYCEEDKVPKIFDPNFLNLLSNAVKSDKEKDGEEDGKVDFYVEGGDHHLMEIKEYETKHPMEEIWVLFTKCYSNERMKRLPLNESDRSICNEIPNIRWQSGDIRFFYKETKICNLFKYLERFMKKVKNKDSIDERVKFVTYIRYYFLRSSYKCQKELEDNIFSMSNLYNEYVENSNSLINKQLTKINSGDIDADIETIEKFKKEFELYIEMVYAEHFQEYGLEANMKSIHDKFKNLFNNNIYSVADIIDDLYEDYKTGNIDKYIDFLMMRDSIKADLYTQARSYKIMKNNKYTDKKNITRPLINVCYFGHLHMVHIKNYLLLDEKYKAVVNVYNELSSSHQDKQNRCVDLAYIENPVNIDGYINFLKQFRKDPSKFLPKS
jgi:hypothetical protein